ncbi:hypothetical protein SAMN02745866_01607 [Alteromonadaceae bacterium Bs31]|nr:hypothetical protein SAMN02745866_01607 [Alteromonadaceae bacterium Bs31]
MAAALLQHYKEKYASRNEGGWRRLLLALKVMAGFSLVSFILYALFWYGHTYDRELPGKYFDSARDYRQIPFDMLDAYSICKHKTKIRYGSELVRSYIDQHSTRFEPGKGIYKIFMSAHIGSKTYYDEAAVHCFVDPSEFMVSHFRIFEPKRESLMSKALSFF